MSRKVRAFLLVCMIAVLAAWVIWANTALEITQIPHINNDLPESFCGFRIAHVSDLHDAELGENHNDLVNALKETAPDIIVLTGDLVDSKRTDIPKSLVFAEQAAAIAPTYYVNGNHEAIIPSQAYIELTEGLIDCGVTVLQDECVSFTRETDRLQLIGLNDIGHLQIPGIDAKIQTMQSTLQSFMTESADFTIVLSHRPELFDAYAACNPNLVLSGHAHGGQFRLPLIGGLVAPGQGLLPEYDSGTYQKNDTTMIVSRGIGNSIIPLRFNNRPELIIITLKTPH